MGNSNNEKRFQKHYTMFFYRRTGFKSSSCVYLLLVIIWLYQNTQSPKLQRLTHQTTKFANITDSILSMVAGQAVENKRKWCQLVGIGLLVFFTETHVGVIHGSKEYKETGQYSYSKLSCSHWNLWSIKTLLNIAIPKPESFKFHSYNCHYRGYNYYYCYCFSSWG